MTSAEGVPPNPAAEEIPDFEDLYVRQTGLCRFTVLNLAGGTPTAYQCNTEELLCRCEDKSYNKGSGEVCKHLAAALFGGNHGYNLDQAIVSRATSELDRVEDAVKSLEQTATAQAADAVADVSETTEDEGEEVTDATDPASQSDAVEHIRDWLETGFAQPQLVDVRAGDHDGRPGVVLEPDNQTMGDGTYEAFKGLVNSQDPTEAHVGFTDEGCQTCGKADDEFYYWIAATEALEVPQ